MDFTGRYGARFGMSMFVILLALGGFGWAAGWEQPRRRAVRLDGGRPLPVMWLSEVEDDSSALRGVQCLAAADVDGDGVRDVVAGRSADGGGELVWLAAPRQDALGTEPAPLGPARELARLPFEPGFVTARCDAAHRPCQLWVGERDGGRLAVVERDRSGDGWTVRTMEMDGRITALAAGELGVPDGLWEVAVGVAAPGGGRVVVIPGRPVAPGAAGVTEEFPPVMWRLPADGAPAALAFAPLLDRGRYQLAAAVSGRLELADGGLPAWRLDEEGVPELSPVDVGERVEGFCARPLRDGAVTALVAFNGEGRFLVEGGSPGAAAVRVRRIEDSGDSPALVASPWGSGTVAVLGGGELAVVPHDTGGKKGTARVAPRQVDLPVAGRLVSAVPVRLTADAFEDYAALVEERGGRTRLVTLATTGRAGLTVDSAGDGGDANPGDGVCDDGTGHCTLRAAIEEANALSGPDTITFSGDFTFTPATELPAVTEALTIQGTGTEIIDGSNLPAGSSGLTVTAGPSSVIHLQITNVPDNSGTGGDGLVLDGAANCILQALTLSNNGGSGLRLWNASHNSIQAVYSTGNGDCGFYQASGSAGNTYSGGEAQSNGLHGLWILGTYDTTVGTCDGGNLLWFTLNGVAGITIQTAYFATGTRVCGCITGAKEVGGTWQAMPNTYGVKVAGDGGAVLTGNVISGNSSHGVWVNGPDGSHSTSLDSNLIGTDADGIGAVANGGWGVVVQDAADVDVGPDDIVSGNTGGGVLLEPYSGTSPVDVAVFNSKIGMNAAHHALGNGGPGIAIHDVDAAMSGSTYVYYVAQNDICDNGGPGVEILNSTIDPEVFVNANVFGECGADAGESILVDGSGGVDTVANWFDAGTKAVVVRNDGYASVTGHNPTRSCTQLLDLEDDGVTPNDPGDTDSGSNDLLNYPEMGVVRACGGQTHIQMGFLDIPAGSGQALISIYAAYEGEPCCPSGHGPADTTVGSLYLPGPGMWTYDLSGELTGRVLTAATTIHRDPGLGFTVGMTSELSECVTVLPTYGGDADDDCDWDARDLSLLVGALHGETLPSGGNGDCTGADGLDTGDLPCTVGEIFSPHVL